MTAATTQVAGSNRAAVKTFRWNWCSAKAIVSTITSVRTNAAATTTAGPAARRSGGSRWKGTQTTVRLPSTIRERWPTVASAGNRYPDNDPGKL
jgi:hypothetical protein